MINVTKPFTPPFAEVQAYLKDVWERNWYTNNGPLVNELELKIRDYLGVRNFLYLNNGTIAIQIAIKALNLSGEIITTPFSYIATTSSIIWENCKPVFADIDEQTLNIDPLAIKNLITPKTSGILATHVFGNPCNVEAISEIAKAYNLKVIYDGAHAFGTMYKGKSLLSYGDVCTTSFHATKLFHTVEGGGVVADDIDLNSTMSYMRNFGHNGPDDFRCVGINGKNSEVHAAVGLVNLKYISEIILRRKELVKYYQSKLESLDVSSILISPDTDWNCSYMPIIFKSERDLLTAVKVLNDNWIYPRRYFYPSLSELSYYKGNSAPITERICRTILCLPLYHDLKKEDVDFIIRLIGSTQS